jgi:hypothetical protein
MSRRAGLIVYTVAIGWILQSANLSFGQGYTNAITSGDWSAPGTWSAGVPTDSLPAAIDGGHTVTISSTSELTNLLDIGTATGQTGTLNVTGGDLTIFDSATGAGNEPNIPSIRIGQVGGSTGNFNLSGGLVTIAGATPSGFADGDLIVGDVGNATMTQTGGILSAVDEIIIGLADVSTAVVNVSGGEFRADGRSILVGFDGNGTLNVSNTGFVRANFDLLVGFLPGSVGTVNLSGGAIETGFLFTNIDGNPAGSSAIVNQTGGTFTTRIAFVLGQRAGTSTMNHSGGLVDVLNNGEFVVGDGPANSSTYNISGTADVNVARNFVAGRDGIGVTNMTGGTIDAANVFLGDFDSSTGTMKISGGTLTLTGNFNVGAALASNAAPDRVEPDGANGPQGQALDANGVLIVSGSAATIDVAGNFLANPDDKSAFRSDPFIAGADNSATLGFEIFNSSGTSLIDVVGIADLDGAVIDVDLMGGFTPTVGTTFDLLTASSFGTTGAGTTENVGTGEAFTLATEDVGAFSLALVPGGRGEILRATFLSGGGGLPGDVDLDGDVDGRDFLAIQRGFGTQYDASDISDFQTNFGMTSPATAAVGAVPEPGAQALVVIAAAGVAAARRRASNLRPTV